MYDINVWHLPSLHNIFLVNISIFLNTPFYLSLVDMSLSLKATAHWVSSQDVWLIKLDISIFLLPQIKCPSSVNHWPPTCHSAHGQNHEFSSSLSPHSQEHQSSSRTSAKCVSAKCSLCSHCLNSEPCWWQDLGKATWPEPQHPISPLRSTLHTQHRDSLKLRCSSFKDSPQGNCSR